MPCVWLSPLTYTIAEFNPNAITHLGDFSSLSSICFQPVDLNRFNKYLEIEYSTKIATSTPLYAYHFDAFEEIRIQAIFDVRFV